MYIIYSTIQSTMQHSSTIVWVQLVYTQQSTPPPSVDRRLKEVSRQPLQPPRCWWWVILGEKAAHKAAKEEVKEEAVEKHNGGERASSPTFKGSHAPQIPNDDEKVYSIEASCCCYPLLPPSSFGLRPLSAFATREAVDVLRLLQVCSDLQGSTSYVQQTDDDLNFVGDELQDQLEDYHAVEFAAIFVDFKKLSIDQ